MAVDWTEFDKDRQSTIMLSLVTSHGRTTPLVGLTVSKDKLKGRRNAYEDAVLARLAQVMPEDVEVTLLADRGFGDHKLFHVLDHGLGFGYVIRFRGNIHVTDAKGETGPSAEWVGTGGLLGGMKMRACASLPVSSTAEVLSVTVPETLAGSS